MATKNDSYNTLMNRLNKTTDYKLLQQRRAAKEAEEKAKLEAQQEAQLAKLKSNTNLRDTDLQSIGERRNSEDAVKAFNEQQAAQRAAQAKVQSDLAFVRKSYDETQAAKLEKLKSNTNLRESDVQSINERRAYDYTITKSDLASAKANTNKAVGNAQTLKTGVAKEANKGKQNYTDSQKDAATKYADTLSNAYKQNYEELVNRYNTQQKAIAGIAKNIASDEELVQFVNGKYEYEEAPDETYFNEVMQSFGPSAEDVTASGPAKEYKFIKDFSEQATDQEKAAVVALYEQDPEVARRYANAMVNTVGVIPQRRGAEISEMQKGNPIRQGMNALTASVQGWGTGVTNTLDMITGKTNVQAGGAREYANEYNTQRIMENRVAAAAANGRTVTGNWAFGKIALDALSSMGNMIPGQIAGAVTAGFTGNAGAGSTVGAVMLGTSAAGKAYAEAIKAGADKNTARVYGVVTGLSEAALEKVLGGIPIISKNTANRQALTGKVAQSVAKVINRVFTNDKVRLLVQWGAEVVKEASGEALEEGLQQVLENHMNKYMLGEEDTETFENVTYAAFLGFVTSGVENSIAGSKVVQQRTEKADSNKQLDDMLATRDVQNLTYLSKNEQTIERIEDITGLTAETDTADLTPAEKKLVSAMKGDGHMAATDVKLTAATAEVMSERYASMSDAVKSAETILYGAPTDADFEAVKVSQDAIDHLNKYLDTLYKRKLEKMSRTEARQEVQNVANGLTSRGINVTMPFGMKGMNNFYQLDSVDKASPQNQTAPTNKPAKKATTPVKQETNVDDVSAADDAVNTEIQRENLTGDGTGNKVKVVKKNAEFYSAGKDGLIKRNGSEIEYNGRTYYADKSRSVGEKKFRYEIYDGESGLIVTPKTVKLGSMQDVYNSMETVDGSVRNIIYDSNGEYKGFYENKVNDFQTQKANGNVDNTFVVEYPARRNANVDNTVPAVDNTQTDTATNPVAEKPAETKKTALEKPEAPKVTTDEAKPRTAKKVQAEGGNGGGGKQKTASGADNGNTAQRKHGITIEAYDYMNEAGKAEIEKLYDQGNMDYEVSSTKGDWRSATANVDSDMNDGGWDRVMATCQRITEGVGRDNGVVTRGDIAYIERALFESRADTSADGLRRYANLSLMAAMVATQYGGLVQMLSVVQYLSPDGRKAFTERTLHRATNNLRSEFKADFESKTPAQKKAIQQEAEAKRKRLDENRKRDVYDLSKNNGQAFDEGQAETENTLREQNRRAATGDVGPAVVTEGLAGDNSRQTRGLRESAQRTGEQVQGVAEEVQGLAQDIHNAKELQRLRNVLQRLTEKLGIPVNEIQSAIDEALKDIDSYEKMDALFDKLLGLRAKLEGMEADTGVKSDGVDEAINAVTRKIERYVVLYEITGDFELASGVKAADLDAELSNLRAQKRKYAQMQRLKRQLQQSETETGVAPENLNDELALFKQQKSKYKKISELQNRLVELWGDTGIDPSEIDAALAKLGRQAEQYQRAKTLKERIAAYEEETGVMTEQIGQFLKENERLAEEYRSFKKLSKALAKHRADTGIDFDKIVAVTKEVKGLRDSYVKLKELRRQLNNLIAETNISTPQKLAESMHDLLQQISEQKAYRRELKRSKQLLRKNRQTVENKLERDLKLLTGDFSLSQDVLEELAEAKTEAEIELAREHAYLELGAQTKMTFLDWLDTLRFTSMLSGTMTFMRNFAGNAERAIYMQAVKTAVALGTKPMKNRTQAVLNPASESDKALLKFARKSYDILKENRLKYGTSVKSAYSLMREGQSTGNRLLDAFFGKGYGYEDNGINKLIRTISFTNLMDKGDLVFLKSLYTLTLAETMKARGLTEKSNATEINKAIEYSIRFAQDTCYHNTSETAKSLTNLEARMKYQAQHGEKFVNKAGGALGYAMIGGLMPFKNVPMQILRIGVVDNTAIGAVKGFFEAKKGDDMGIIHLAQGLSGVALTVLGAYLASMGRLHTEDNDDENKLLNASGIQPYSIDIAGYNVGISWMGPEALALLTGAVIYDCMKDSFEFRDILNVAGAMTAPVLDTTVLSGIDEFITATQYYGWQGAVSRPLSAYLQQFSPQLLSQFNRTFIDTKKRSLTTTRSEGGVENNAKQLLNYFASRTPGLSYTLEEYVDQWGNVTDTGNVMTRAWNNFLDIGSVDKIKVTDVDKELIRLCQYEEDGVVVKRENVAPTTSATKTVNVRNKDGTEETVELTGEQIKQFKVTKGQTSYRMLNEIFATDTYKNLSDERKALVVESVYQYATAVAKMEVGRTEPDAWILKLKTGYGGLSAAEVLACQAVLKGEGNSKADTLNALNNAGLGSVSMRYYRSYVAADKNDWLREAKKAGVWEYTKDARTE